MNHPTKERQGGVVTAMRWKRLGRVLRPGMADWMKSHCAVPSIEQREEDLFRIYFTSRDDEGRSQTGYAEIDMRNPSEVLRVSERPVLERGTLGAFDDRGAMCSSVVPHDGMLYMYYIGWNLGVTVPFYSFAGLAISDDGGETFQRHSRGYLLGRDDVDPYISTNPYVLKDDDGKWRMWYISGVRWVLEDGKPKHYYHLKHAVSDDGLAWNREGKVSVDFKNDSEYAIANPHVIKENGLYKIWYSYRGHRYRIGYAESTDGVAFERKDEMMDFTVGEQGEWDDEMVEYGCVFDYNGNRYMLYNGNGYGRTGMGIAVIED